MKEFYGDNKFNKMKSEYSKYVKDFTVEDKKIKVVFYNVPGWEAIKLIFQQTCLTSKIVDLPKGFSIDRA